MPPPLDSPKSARFVPAIELAALALIVALGLGLFALILRTYRTAPPEPVQFVAVVAPLPAPVVVVAPKPEAPPVPPPLMDLVERAAPERTWAEALPGPIRALANGLKQTTEELLRRAKLAEVRAKRLEESARAENLAKRDQARQRATEAETLAWESDRLAKELDEAKRERALEERSPKHVVAPVRSARGTLQVPILVECRAEGARPLPDGLLVPAALIAPEFANEGPFLAEVRKRAEALRSRNEPGAAPFVFFAVRPEGIATFYDARKALEPLGFAFGYELVDSDWRLDDEKKIAPQRLELVEPAPAWRERPSERPSVRSEGGPAPLAMGGGGSRTPRGPREGGGPGALAPASQGTGGNAGGGVSGAGPSPSGGGPRPPRTFEIVLVCGPEGLVLSPGGARISRAKLDGPGREWLDYLKTMVETAQWSDLGQRVAPSVRFLVNPGGQSVYLQARGQLELALPTWPAQLDLPEFDRPRLFSRGTRP